MASSNSSAASPQAEGETLQFWLGTVSVIILAVLGILANVCVFWMWQAEKAFKTTTFLFKALSVWDAAFLLLSIVFTQKATLTLTTTYSEDAVFHLCNLAQLLSIHFTLIIAVTRWVAVTYPFHASRLLTSFRVFSACGAVSAWCFILEVLDVLNTVYNVYRQPNIPLYTDLQTAKRVVGLAVPLLVLLGFNLSLVSTLSHQPDDLQEKTGSPGDQDQRKASGPQRSFITSSSLDVSSPVTDNTFVSADTSPGLQKKSQAPQSHKGGQEEEPLGGPPPAQLGKGCPPGGDGGVPLPVTRRRPGRQRLSKLQKRQRVTVVVLLMSLCCFVSYPLGLGLQIYAQISGDQSIWEIPALYRTQLVMYNLQIVNSGINVLFYLFFLSKFRKLAHFRLSGCANLCGEMPS